VRASCRWPHAGRRNSAWLCRLADAGGHAAQQVRPKLAASKATPSLPRECRVRAMTRAVAGAGAGYVIGLLAALPPPSRRRPATRRGWPPASGQARGTPWSGSGVLEITAPTAAWESVRRWPGASCRIQCVRRLLCEVAEQDGAS
jgi:hypothetical protein